MIGPLRVWPPERSKLAALYYLGSGPEIIKTDQILYLGAASGTTVSFIADYADVVYAVEIAPEPLAKLLDVCNNRMNILPIPADAATPLVYAPFVSTVDLLYQDIAQKEQVEIVLNNLVFLKSGGYLILMLKTRSVATQEDPEQICSKAVSKLQNAGLDDIKVTWLDRYHRDHAAIVCKKRDLKEL
ncbi:fibrillarin-like rRNA/tRNA 2'-O-methyltransferase [Methanospirillum lacunae]|uniref:rRNA 2'-O-methyltransferase fibrillarin n=2 Tax=Methanospirillum lacunae TaxID=668570 RepID=A0A2V2N465_9EURY|nr:fibrillarin-like rRNA/tRNA 2'-O-methyltransferase [Methanospirillum lacunae]